MLLCWCNLLHDTTKERKILFKLKFTNSIFWISEILVNFLPCECDNLLHLHLRQYYLVTLCICIQILKLILIMEREELRQFGCVNNYHLSVLMCKWILQNRYNSNRVGGNLGIQQNVTIFSQKSCFQLWCV